MITPRFAEDQAEKATDPIPAAVWALVAEVGYLRRDLSGLVVKDEAQKLLMRAIAERIDENWLKEARDIVGSDSSALSERK